MNDELEALDERLGNAEDLLMVIFERLYKGSSRREREVLEDCFTKTFGRKPSKYGDAEPVYMWERFERMASTIREDERTGWDE